MTGIATSSPVCHGTDAVLLCKRPRWPFTAENLAGRFAARSTGLCRRARHQEFLYRGQEEQDREPTLTQRKTGGLLLGQDRSAHKIAQPHSTTPSNSVI